MSVVEMKVPEVGESVTEVTLATWLKKDGEYVEMDEPICEFESDKATLELPAEASGKLIHVAAEDDDLAIGDLVAKIDTSVSQGGEGGESESEPDEEEEKEEQEDKGKAEEEKEKEEKEEKEPQPSASKGKMSDHASPAAAKILKENDIDPGEVEGTGKDGRITKEDANRAVEAKKEQKEEKKAKEEKVEREEKQKEAPETAERESFSRNTR
ncbi:MAG: biotin/lipoyl-containing protein, partial [Saprospiraceae bacterium]|nr:biotin/lipoyl-containing protein [Saprospiraceae bacterium]